MGEQVFGWGAVQLKSAVGQERAVVKRESSRSTLEATGTQPAPRSGRPSLPVRVGQPVMHDA